MPELPEVETVRQGLAPAMERARIARVELRRSDLRFPFPERFAETLQGRRVLALSRRAKYLLADLEGDLLLAMHLGMSGSFRVEQAAAGGYAPGLFHHPRGQARAHDHVLFHLEPEHGAPATVVFNDPRRFGYMTLMKRAEVDTHPHFRHLGIEPVGEALSGAALAPLLQARGAPLKAVLLDQRVIAGLGNIYVCEALWRARLSPRRAAGTLVKGNGRATERLDRLAAAIRETIADAILAGGSTLRDHRQVDGTLGAFQHRFAVYGREGQPCAREGCRGSVARIVQGGRSTFFCPACQR